MIHNQLFDLGGADLQVTGDAPCDQAVHQQQTSSMSLGRLVQLQAALTSPTAASNLSRLSQEVQRSRDLLPSRWMEGDPRTGCDAQES